MLNPEYSTLTVSIHGDSLTFLKRPSASITQHTQTHSNIECNYVRSLHGNGLVWNWRMSGRGRHFCSPRSEGCPLTHMHIPTGHLRWIIVRKWKLGPLARLPVQCWLRALSVFLSPSLSLTHTLYSCSLSPLGHSPLSSCCKFHWKLETQTCPCP